MTREKLAFYRNDIIAAYTSGTSATQIAKRYNTSTTTVTRLLKAEGVMPYVPRGAFVRQDAPEIIRAFNDGVSPAEIIKRFSISKSGLYQMLKKAGCELRGLEARPAPYARRIRMAEGRERVGCLNANEQKVSNILSTAGFEARAQVRVGTGSVDLVVANPPVAVEVSLRGTLTRSINSGLFRDRIRQSAERGWHFYAFCGFEADDLSVETAKDMLLWLDFLRQAPPSRRQYRVVWGGTELLAAGCSDDDEITLVTPAVHRAQRAKRKASV